MICPFFREYQVLYALWWHPIDQGVNELSYLEVVNLILFLFWLSFALKLNFLRLQNLLKVDLDFINLELRVFRFLASANILKYLSLIKR